MYKKFYLNKVFHIKNTHNIMSTEIKLDSGNTPYVTASSLNNSVQSYITYDEKLKDDGNSIFIGGKTLVISYQDKDYFSNDSHNLCLILKEDDYRTEKVYLYLVSALYKNLKSKYSWGNSISKTKIQEDYCELPILLDDNNNPVIDSTHKYHNLGFIPNFHYMEERISELMEERISELMEERISELNAYLKVSGLIDYELTKEDKEILNKHVSLVTFKLEEVFDIVGTKSLDAGAVEFVKEGINFVGRTGDNNGVQGKIAKQKFGPNEANTITATVIGNYKYVKYQQEPYYCSQNINKLTLKAENTINEDIALYLMSNIYKFVSKYNGQQGGYKLDDIKNHIISLPIKNNASAKNLQNVDFDYMEKYIKVLKKIIIEDVVKYKDRVIDETKNVISNT